MVCAQFNLLLLTWLLISLLEIGFLVGSQKLPFESDLCKSGNHYNHESVSADSVKMADPHLGVLKCIPKTSSMVIAHFRSAWTLASHSLSMQPKNQCHYTTRHPRWACLIGIEALARSVLHRLWNNSIVVCIKGRWSHTCTSWARLPDSMTLRNRLMNRVKDNTGCRTTTNQKILSTHYTSVFQHYAYDERVLFGGGTCFWCVLDPEPFQNGKHKFSQKSWMLGARSECSQTACLLIDQCTKYVHGK